jgi:hypothetical protein
MHRALHTQLVGQLDSAAHSEIHAQSSNPFAPSCTHGEHAPTSSRAPQAGSNTTTASSEGSFTG